MVELLAAGLKHKKQKQGRRHLALHGLECVERTEQENFPRDLTATYHSSEFDQGRNENQTTSV